MRIRPAALRTVSALALGREEGSRGTVTVSATKVHTNSWAWRASIFESARIRGTRSRRSPSKTVARSTRPRIGPSSCTGASGCLRRRTARTPLLRPILTPGLRSWRSDRLGISRWLTDLKTIDAADRSAGRGLADRLQPDDRTRAIRKTPRPHSLSRRLQSWTRGVDRLSCANFQAQRDSVARRN